MSAAIPASSITPRRIARIEVANDLSLSDLSLFCGISVNKLSGHLRDVVDPLPSYNWGRKHLVNKAEFLAWRTRRFSTAEPDSAIVAPRRRRRKSRS